MFKMKAALFLVFILFALIVQPAFAERPLEDASYTEGMKAITEMHVLNSLGLAGELIGIYKGLNQASYAAAILHDRKYTPGDDDLSWVDDPNYGKIRHDPFAGLSKKDKAIVKRRLGDIQRFNKMIESRNYSNVDQKNEIIQGIENQVEGLKRTLASYPDFYAKAFPKEVATVELKKVSNQNAIRQIGPHNIDSEWNYLKGKGVCTISQSAEHLSMVCTYTPSKLKGPHYEVTGTLNGNLWHAQWKCLGQAAEKKGERCKGSLTARIDSSWNEIVITKAVDPTNEGWVGLVLTKK